MVSSGPRAPISVRLRSNTLTPSMQPTEPVWIATTVDGQMNTLYLVGVNEITALGAGTPLIQVSLPSFTRGTPRHKHHEARLCRGESEGETHMPQRSLASQPQRQSLRASRH